MQGWEKFKMNGSDHKKKTQCALASDPHFGGKMDQGDEHPSL